MGSWLNCICGARIHTNFFTGTDIYKLIKDADYDAVGEPLTWQKLQDLFFQKGVTVYHCRSCGRLAIEWGDDGGVTFYKLEGTGR